MKLRFTLTLGVAWWIAALCLARQDPPAAAPPPSVQTSELTLELETFGVGGVTRPGEWAGVRIALTDANPTPRDVLLRLHLKDSDGDSVMLERAVSTTPGEKRATWLYPPMPPLLAAGAVFTVSAHELDTQSSPPALKREVAIVRFSVTTVIESHVGLIGLLGRNLAGLDQYAQPPVGSPAPLVANEYTEIAAGLRMEDLPDHWLGLSMFEALVWQPASTETFGVESTAGAVREWVNRGGHLVILPPTIGDAWAASSGILADLLPVAEVERVEDVSLEPFRRLLTAPAAGGERAPLPEKTVARRFVIADGTPSTDAMPIIAGPEGVIVCRRIVGAGMVTVVGLDVQHRQLAGVLRADAFWNRILGKRRDTPAREQLTAATGSPASSWGSGLGATWVDRSIGDDISRKRTAGVGILAALTLFVLYWLFFGWGGFQVLSIRGWTRHSWLVAFASTIVWALIAWAIASALRPTEVIAWHFTMLDHVYGQPVSRAKAWWSLLLPSYGESRVRLGEPGADEPWRQALTPWTDPETFGIEAFPDARSYSIDSRRPDSMTIPTRSTIKQFQAEWLGGPRWRLPTPAAEGAEPRFISDGSLAGQLVHGLPGPLEQAVVVVVGGQMPPRDEPSPGTSRLFAQAWAWELRDPWRPGDVLDLAPLGPNPIAAAESVLDDWVPRVTLTALPDLTGSTRDDRLIAFFSMLSQPDYRSQDLPIGSVRSMPRRRMVHGPDLGRWFTQPCVIIVGYVGAATMPIPAQVDEAPCPSEGRTLLRWVYPLAPKPLRFTTAPARDTAPRR